MKLFLIVIASLGLLAPQISRAELSLPEIQKVWSTSAGDGPWIKEMQSQIPLAYLSSTPKDALERARKYLDALNYIPPLQSGEQESQGVERLRPLFHAAGAVLATMDPQNPDTIIFISKNETVQVGDRRYVDLTNGSIFETHARNNGTVHYWAAERALESGYTVSLNTRTGNMSTHHYNSDELLVPYVMDKSGSPVADLAKAEILIRSEPKWDGSDGSTVGSSSPYEDLAKIGYTFEDGRAFRTSGRLFLAGTLVSRFIPGSPDLHYRNVIVEMLEDPDTGRPSVRMSHVPGVPAFHFISPKPTRELSWETKNSMVFNNGAGDEVVAFYRLCLNENTVRNLRPLYGARIQGGYQLWSLTFPNIEAYLAYDHDHLPGAIFEEHLGKDSTSPRHPQIIMTEKDISDPYLSDPRVSHKEDGAPKIGFGPGSRPFFVRMDKDRNVFVSQENTESTDKMALIDAVSEDESNRYMLKPGEGNWIFPIHLLRYYVHEGFPFRHYNGGFLVMDESMRVKKGIIRSGLSPERDFEKGRSRKIMNLSDHVYPAGLVVVNGTVYLSYGASDTHTGMAKIDVKKLLRNFSLRMGRCDALLVPGASAVIAGS